MSGNYKKAKELAARPYVTMVYLHLTTDGKDYVFVAENPDIKGSKAQGLTMKEAQENLEEVRIDLIEHFLDHNLSVPDPMWVAVADALNNVDNRAGIEEIELTTEPENLDVLLMV